MREKYFLKQPKENQKISLNLEINKNEEMKKEEQKEVKRIEINNIEESVNGKLITIEEIIQILRKKPKFENYIKIIKEGDEIYALILKEMNPKNTKRKQEVKKNNLEIEIKEEKAKGRKRIGDNSKRGHNKISTDNIIKKIKQYLLNYLIKSILENLKESKEYKLKKLDYKENVNNINKQNELNYLYMPINQLLSGPISSKYKNFKSDFNQKMIKEILNKESKNEVIKYIFNLTFREYIDIFIMKKEPSIKDVKFDGLDSFFEQILKKNDNDKNYFKNLVFCLYNYERWLICRNKRIVKKVPKVI